MEKKKRSPAEHAMNSQEFTEGLAYPLVVWRVTDDVWREIDMHEGMVEVEKNVSRLEWTR
jgi:hypothetical protein